MNRPCIRLWLMVLVFFLYLAITHGLKSIVLIRHSITQMNEYLHTEEGAWGRDGFVDPLYWDTRLSEAGIELAKRKNNIQPQCISQIT